MEALRKISFDYFNGQIGYKIAMFGKVNNHVQKLWLNGEEFSGIVKEIINTELMTESVKRCKVFILSIIEVDINSKENTMQIIYGFVDYLRSMYDKLEELTGINKKF